MIFQDHSNYFQNPYYTSKDQKEPELFDPQEALMLGNFFKNLYMSYRGFSNYCLQPMNPRQKMLLDVQINEFAAHEINLYLDVHPEHQDMIVLYHDYQQKAKQAKAAYEKQFGPLTVDHSDETAPFQWIQGPWPWEYQI